MQIMPEAWSSWALDRELFSLPQKQEKLVESYLWSSNSLKRKWHKSKNFVYEEIWVVYQTEIPPYENTFFSWITVIADTYDLSKIVKCVWRQD